MNVAKNNHKKIEVNLMLSSSCEICEIDLKKSFYEDKYFEKPLLTALDLWHIQTSDVITLFGIVL